MTHWLAYALLIVAGLTAVGGIWRITDIGKDRKPITTTEGAAYVVWAAIYTTIFVLAALRLLT